MSSVSPHSSAFSVCYVTAPSKTVAESIASHLVATKAAACVNMLPGVTSVYTWQGKVEKDEELLLMIKTQTSVVPRLIEEVRPPLRRARGDLGADGCGPHRLSELGH